MYKVSVSVSDSTGLGLGKVGLGLGLGLGWTGLGLGLGLEGLDYITATHALRLSIGLRISTAYAMGEIDKVLAFSFTFVRGDSPCPPCAAESLIRKLKSKFLKVDDMPLIS